MAADKGEYTYCSDEDLLAFSDESGQAVAELLARYVSIVGSKARCMASGARAPFSPDADDLAQEGMLGLMSAIRTYRLDGVASFATYANICISNRMRSAVVRSGGRRGTKIELFPDDQGDYSVGSGESPEEILLDREKTQELHAQIRTSLSPMERRVLALYLKGFSYEQVSCRLRTSRKAVDNALQRVRRKLKSVRH